MIKFFLPLIAALKVGAGGHDGWSLGVAVAQAFKGCKEELNRPIDRNQDDVVR